MKTVNNKLTIVARVLLGLVFFVLGLNGFLQFFTPPAMPGKAAAFVEALKETGYLFQMVFAIYVIAGAALLSGRFVPLALTVLAPIIVNILALHLFLAPAGLGFAGFVAAIEVFLACSYRASFRPLLQGSDVSIGSNPTGVREFASSR